MTREILAVGTPTIIIGFCWGFSLRRTPWPSLWFLSMLPLWIFGVAGAWAAAVSSGVSLGGFIAILGASIFVPVLCSFEVEMCATDPCDKGPTRAWRVANAKPKAHERWRLECEALSDSQVEVRIGQGEKRRKIGVADPIEDLDEFMNLRAKAEQAAESYNTLSIGA